MKVIAFTGMPGSGKSIIIESLKKEGYETVYMGNIIRLEMEEKNIQAKSKNVRNFATEFRKKHGDDIVARRCLPELKEKLSHSSDKPVIIEDIKGIAEVEYFRKELGEDFQLIAIHASPKIRFERSRERESEWDEKTVGSYEEFQWRDKMEMSWGLGEAIALADHIVINDSTEEELVNKIVGHYHYLLETGELFQREVQQSRREIERLLQNQISLRMQRLVSAQERDHFVSAVAKREMDPYSAAERLLELANDHHS